MVSLPMTLIVMIAVVVLYVFGIVLLRCANQSSDDARGLVCSHCSNGNRAGARFCARCGKPLRGAS